MKSILIGGGGFIGKHLTNLLDENQDEIVIVDNFAYPAHSNKARSIEFFENKRRKNIAVIETDYALVENYTKHLEGADVVYLMAADTGTGRSFQEPHHCINENVYKLSILLNTIKECNKSCKVVFFSSRAVYGNGLYSCNKCGSGTEIMRSPVDGEFEPRCKQCKSKAYFNKMSEKHPLEPTSVYGVSKLAGEKLVDVLLPDHSVTIIRPQNVYGSHQEVHNPYTGLVTWFCNSLHIGKEVEVYEQNYITRDFIHVLDLVEMIHKIVTSEPSGNRSVFNIGSGEEITLVELAQTMAKVIDKKGKITVNSKFRNGDVLNARADMSFYNFQFGVHDCISIDKGIREFYEWYQLTDGR